MTSEESSDESDPESDNGTEHILSGERTIEQQQAMDNLIPALEPSEYGRMPPCFHDNSQRVADDVPKLATPDDQTKPKAKPIRPPILLRDKYDGVDSDDETDLEDVDSEEEEERPQVIGEIEIDMQQEEEEFIEFSRQALGISDAQWAEIVKDRKERGGMGRFR